MQAISENRLEDELQACCVDHGPLEKITAIYKTKVVTIKFVEPTAASKALQAWHGSVNEWTKQKLEAIYWDGVTDYTHKQHEEAVEEEEKRHDEFGDWLETQEELPPEFQSQVEEKRVRLHTISIIGSEPVRMQRNTLVAYPAPESQLLVIMRIQSRIQSRTRIKDSDE
jgi:hypothetical protein